MDFLIGLLGFLAIFWFFLINPQRKKEKQRQDLINSLEKGDKVVTLGGIYGTVSQVKDRSFLLQIAEGVEIEVAKSSIGYVRTDDEDDEEEDEDEAADDEPEGQNQR